MDVIHAIRDTGQVWDAEDAASSLIQDVLEVATDYEGLSAKRLVELARGNDDFMWVYDEEGAMAHSEFLREVFERAGYDGIEDRTVAAKFRMMYLNSDDVHYVAFKPNQIKSAIGNAGTFDAANPDIRFSTRQESEHESIVREAVQAGRWVPENVLQEYADQEWAQEEARQRFDDRQDAAEAMSQDQDEEDFVMMSMAMTEGRARDQKYWREIYRSADIKSAQKTPEQIAAAWAGGLTKESLSAYLREIAFNGDANEISDRIIGNLAKHIGTTGTLTDAQFRKAMDKINYDQVTWFQELSGLTENIEDLQNMEEALVSHPDASELLKRKRQIQDLKKQLQKQEMTSSNLQHEIELAAKYENDLRKVIKALEAKNVKAAEALAAEVQANKDTQRIYGKALTEKAGEVREIMKRLARATNDTVKFDQARDDAISKASEMIREVKNQVKARIEARNIINRMIKSIMKRPATTIDYEYAKQISEMQQGLDIRSHRRGRYAQVFNQVRDAMPEGIAKAELQRMLDEAIGNRSLRDMDLDELIDIYDQIEDLKAEGREVYRQKKAAQREQDLKDMVTMLDELGYTVDQTREMVANVGEKFQESRRSNVFRKAQFQLYNMKRLTDAMGPTWKQMFDIKVNELTDQKLRYKFERLEALDKFKKQLGIKTSDLLKDATDDYTVQEVMGIFIAQQNEDSLAALMNGNKITQRQLRQAKAFLDANPKYQRLAEGLMNLFDDESFERLQRAFIESTNTGMVRVENYFPMRRMNLTQTSYDEDVSFDLASRTHAGRTYAWKGFSYQRQHQRKEQNPIRLDAMMIALEGVEQQEHYAAFAVHVKKMHRMLSMTEVEAAFSDKFGSDAYKVMKEYVDRIANPKVVQQTRQMDRILQTARTNMTMGALAYNLMSPIKNLIGPLLYLPHISRGNAWSTLAAIPMLVYEMLRFMSPHNLYREDGKLKHRMIEAVFERNPQARNRSLDPNLREGAALKAKGVRGVIKKITEAGLQPLGWIDTWTIIVGEEAVFQMEMLNSNDEAKATAAAQEATLRTQPFGSEKDSPAAYTSNFFKALAMFSSPLNQIFGMATNDFGRDVARGKLGKAGLTLVSLAMTGVLMSIMEQKRLPDPDDEEGVKQFWIDVSSQFIEMIPILGPEILGGMRGSPFVGKGFSITGWMRYLAPTVKRIADPEAEFEEKLDSAVRTLTAGTQILGVPSVGLRRLYNTFTPDEGDIDLWELFGGAPEER
jgi:hypothetical protein